MEQVKERPKCNCDCEKRYKAEIKALKERNIELEKENKALKEFIGGK